MMITKTEAIKIINKLEKESLEEYDKNWHKTNDIIKTCSGGNLQITKSCNGKITKNYKDKSTK